MTDNLVFQEGVIRAKLANVLDGYNDVHYETSFASEENIRLVCNIVIIDGEFY